MTAFIDLEMVGNTAQVNRMLDYLWGVFSPQGMSAFLGERIGPYLQSRAENRFAGEGDDAVGAWAPLKPTTEEIRARYQYGATGPINRRTGELEDYITSSGWAVSMDSLGAILSFPGLPSRGQALQEKMRTAQQGRTFPSTVPRPVLGVNETDLAFVVTSLAFLIQRGQFV